MTDQSNGRTKGNADETQGNGLWVVVDINGNLEARHGYFRTETACQDHIRNRIDSADDRMYDRDSMFEPAEIHEHPPEPAVPEPQDGHPAEDETYPAAYATRAEYERSGA